MTTYNTDCTLGELPHFVPFHVCDTTFVLDVGTVVEIAPATPSIHLAPNHQDYTPNHRKQRRGKFKRNGRR